MKNIFTALLILTVAAETRAQTGIPVPQMHKTDSLVKVFMQTYGVPGATVAISKDGKLIYNRAFGKASATATDTMQPHHLLRIASNSKPITGVAIMKLVEGGQLSLNDTVFGPTRILNNTYFLSSITDARIYNITVKQLLEHTAGWNRDIGCDGFSHCDPIGFPLHVSNTLSAPKPVPDSALIKFLLTKGLNFAPGTAYNYSNIGYLVLAKIIEKKTGMSYADYVASVINTPLGLCDLKLGKNLLADRQEREGQYIQSGTTQSSYGTGQTVPWQYGGWNLEAMHAHGGFIASSADYVKFILAVDGFSTFPDILQPATVTTMSTGSSSNAGYAKGWSVNSTGHRWHLGSLDGTAAFMCRANNGYAWAIHLNTRGNTNAFWNAFDALPWNSIAQMTGVPTHDLFPPAQQATALTATPAGAGSAQLSWTPGSGDMRLVLATESSSWTAFPTDGRAYAANTAYGSGSDLGGGTFAVYYGAGSSATITGLDPTKTYRFTVVEAFQNATTGGAPVYKHGCRSAASVNDPTDVQSPQLAGGLSVFPNPASGQVTLRGGASLRGARVRLCNMAGQVLGEWKGVEAAMLVLDTNPFVPGVYVVEVARPDGVQRVRLVKR